MRNELFEDKLILAPMAGYTDLPFRLLAQEYGADASISEMVSAKGLYYKDKKTEHLLMSVPEEKNYGIQIFGSEPQILAYAAGHLCERRRDPDDPLDFDFIDFNAGCPAPKIVKNGDGSALIQNPKLLGECVEAIVKASDVPVSMKTRKGFLRGENFAGKLAEIGESAGASAVTIHGRTRTEYYSGQADYDAVADAVAAVDIPVILSGDIRNPQDAKRAMETGAASLMIGRGAVGAPWVFDQIKSGTDFAGGRNIEITPEERVRAALRHIDLTLAYNFGRYAMVEMRKHLAAYTKGLPNASKLRQEIFKVTTPEEARAVFLSALPS